MTYFEDLTEYTYLPGGENALNVGWLSGCHPFNTGQVSSIVVDELARMCAAPVQKTRGIHFCDICPTLSPAEYRARWDELTTFASSIGPVFVGNGELRVLGMSGTLYAAPTLIVHYMSVHRYMPPEDFVRGVLAVTSQ